MTTPAPRRRYTKRVKDTPDAETAPVTRPADALDATIAPVTRSTDKLDPETAVMIGRITSIHGIKGELRVMPVTDFPERFDAGAEVWLDGKPTHVTRRRWSGKEMILALEGVDTRDAADALRGKDLMAPSPTQLEEGIFYQHDIVGLQAVTPQGETLGRVSEVISTGSNDVYVVVGDRGELLIPALEGVVHEVDLANGRIVVEVIEGLEFTRAATPRTRRPTGEERRLAGEPKDAG